MHEISEYIISVINYRTLTYRLGGKAGSPMLGVEGKYAGGSPLIECIL